MVHELPLPLVEGKTTVSVGCSIAKERHRLTLFDDPNNGFSGDGGYCGHIAGAKPKTLLR